MIEYKFDEDRILKDVKDYIDGTYNEHYADGRIQTNEFIMSHLNSNEGFKLNILKYVTRYGHKDGNNRKDLLKAIHYLIFMLCYHDRKYEKKSAKDMIDHYKKEKKLPLDAVTATTDEFGNRTTVKLDQIGPLPYPYQTNEAFSTTYEIDAFGSIKLKDEPALGANTDMKPEETEGGIEFPDSETRVSMENCTLQNCNLHLPGAESANDPVANGYIDWIRRHEEEQDNEEFFEELQKEIDKESWNDPIYELNKEMFDPDWKRNDRAWEEAEKSIERLESERKL